MAMENGPFEDIFPIENGDIPACYVSLPEVIQFVSLFTGFHTSQVVTAGFFEPSTNSCLTINTKARNLIRNPY